MVGGTKRLPRAVREQQMLDAAVRYSPTTASGTPRWTPSPPGGDLKPMLYLYYGSKEELFGACMSRESSRFIGR